MNHYFKCRAEKLAHIIALIESMQIGVNIDHICVTYIRIPFPDVECTFYTTEDLKTIKDNISRIADSHVMQQTVAPFDLYTGKCH